MTTQQRETISIPQVDARIPIPTHHLRIPGPTTLPPEVMAVQANQMINHRGPEFAAIVKRVTLRLEYFFQTSSPVMSFAASGTGGQESAIVNLFSPGDHIVALTVGNFSGRFAAVAEAYGLQVTRLDFPWGQAADPATVEARLKELPPYRGVIMAHNETSTGVTNDVQALAALIRRLAPDALIAVDAVSSLGCIPLEMDQWGIDVVLTGSQKGWMCPPGMTMVAANQRAIQASKTAKLPRFYFDWAAMQQSVKQWQQPATPAVSIFYALDVALEMMLAEGRQAIFERHLRAGEYVRERAAAMGVDVLATPECASNTVTALITPLGINTEVLLMKLREQDNIVLATGQDHMKDKIFRLGHLGFFTEDNIVETMDKLQLRLGELGFKG